MTSVSDSGHSNDSYCLIAQMHPALNFRGGTANLVKALLTYPDHPFKAMISADTAGPDPLHGPWDDIPTLALFRPRSMFPKLSIGLGLLDNPAYRLQAKRMAGFLEKHKIARIFAIITNSTRFARLVEYLPSHIPLDLYIIDDPVADAGLYRMDEAKAQATFQRLIQRGSRLFAISPVYAEEIEEKYNRPCHFLPILIRDSILNAPAQPVNRPKDQPLTLHHAGQIHHLYADTMARISKLLSLIAAKRGEHIVLELWGNIDAGDIQKKLDIRFDDNNRWQNGKFTVKLCGETTLEKLTQHQKRADFLLLVNSFLPEMERQIRCSYTSKVCEYMISGVPILLYAPSYSGPARELGRQNAAHVLTDPDMDSALARLEELLFQKNKEKTVEPARKLALQSHSSETFFKTILTTPMHPENENRIPWRSDSVSSVPSVVKK